MVYKSLILTICTVVYLGCTTKSNSKLETVNSCGVVAEEKTQITEPKLFKAKCASCHSFKKDLTGPRMKGVLKRVPSEEWLEEFIRNQDSLIQVNDEYTLEIMKGSSVEWSHNFNALKEKELEELITFISQ